MSRKGRAAQKPVKKATAMADYARLFASRGGNARAKALTTAELRAIGVKGPKVRWSKKRKPK